ncbi:MAG: DegT/DnrJ/EryC1/StrS family aminotransferase [Candidatus Gottesmanbacteria bacterium]|nr:DegT/DnrJ/EryC1/StrS family aminotransferase [Candidatus Gottesmanbacteria bacterium]
MKSIPFWNPLPEYEKIATEVHTAIARVLSSGTLILGPEVAAFETSFAQYIGCRYGIGVGNGTDAIILALKALGVGQDDEVITAANTAIPTVAAIMAVGAVPKLVDVLPDSLLMDPAKLQGAITKRTRAIIPVHLYGQSCDMDTIMKIATSKKVFVIEDCAQATGAEYKSKVSAKGGPAYGRKSRKSKVGSMGSIATFSFYPTKIIGCYGDGGMITTNNPALAKRVRSLRMYGTEGTYNAIIEGGINSRLDELQAAILSVKLKNIKRWIKERQRLAHRYNQGLKSTPLILPSQPQKVSPFEANSHVFHLYIIRHTKRIEIQKYLRMHGIGTAIHYPVPIHLMPAYSKLGYEKGDFPVAEGACHSVLSLPLYPGLTDDDQDRIINALRAYFK